MTYNVLFYHTNAKPDHLSLKVDKFSTGPAAFKQDTSMKLAALDTKLDPERKEWALLSDGHPFEKCSTVKGLNNVPTTLPRKETPTGQNLLSGVFQGPTIEYNNPSISCSGSASETSVDKMPGNAYQLDQSPSMTSPMMVIGMSDRLRSYDTGKLPAPYNRDSRVPTDFRVKYTQKPHRIWMPLPNVLRDDAPHEVSVNAYTSPVSATILECSTYRMSPSARRRAFKSRNMTVE
ncbi:unnamed protein product [Fusarium equiseti]|uniref:Uncharacterized protein n=1 Tax=Fusarium equiseti TaxID=61235 RepID=A0A8J2IPL4_FUSEQ|nr:unnamed protein product [Fusarium equiseti]